MPKSKMHFVNAARVLLLGIVLCFGQALGAETNQAPIVESQTLVTPENSSFVITLQAADPENAPVSFRISEVPAAGTLFQYTNGVVGPAITTNGTPVQDLAGQVLFTPGDRQWGDPYASFRFVANDGVQDSAPALVTIIVPRNYEAVVESLAFSIPQGTNLVITLAATDAENDPLLFRVQTPPGAGTLFQFTNGGQGAPITATNTVVTDAAHRVVFVPAPLESGSPYAIFTYVANDSLHDSAPGSVVIHVLPANRAPTVQGQTIGMPWNSKTVITLTGSDPDAEPITFRITGTPNQGSLYQYNAGNPGALITGTNTLVSDSIGRVFFVPANNQAGDPYASFTFVADDGQARSSAATVDIRVARPAFGATHAPWILRTNITLRGMVSANGTAAAWWFEWGSNMASKTTPVVLPATNGVLAVSAPVSGVSPGVSYGCRMVVSNAAGVVYGNMELFGVGAKVWGWGRNDFTNLPVALSNVVAVEAGYNHAVALKNDGKVVAWGLNNKNQTNVPSGLSNVVAISAKADHTLALRSDGTIVTWGDNSFGQLNLPAGLTNIVQISAGYSHSMVLQANGRVVSWGYPFVPVVTNVPAAVTNIVAISAGSAWSVALRNDGVPFAWGNDNFGDTMMPPGLSNVWLVSAGDAHGLAYRRNGTGVGWGWNYYGQSSFPAGLTNVVKVLAGDFQSLALREDGRVVGWGYAPLASVPGGVSNVVNLAAGVNFNLAVGTTNALHPEEKGPPIPEVPTILSVRTNPQGRFEMNFAGSQGAAYQVWATTNLVSWVQAETPEEISPGNYRFIEPPGVASGWRIFRVRSP